MLLAAQQIRDSNYIDKKIEEAEALLRLRKWAVIHPSSYERKDVVEKAVYKGMATRRWRQFQHRLLSERAVIYPPARERNEWAEKAIHKCKFCGTAAHDVTIWWRARWWRVIGMVAWATNAKKMKLWTMPWQSSRNSACETISKRNSKTLK